MKNGIFIILSIFTLRICAQADADIFAKAITAYQSGHYEQATSLWLEINRKVPAVWLNAGASAYHSGKKIDALVYWLRAASLARGSERRTSLELANKVGHELGIATSYLSSPLDTLHRRMPLLGLQLLAILLLIWLVVHMSMAFARRWHILIALILVASIITYGLYRTYYELWYPYAVVVKEQVKLYAGPDEQFEALGTLPLGSIIIILERAQGWYKVRYKQQHGWAVGATMAELQQ